MAYVFFENIFNKYNDHEKHWPNNFAGGVGQPME